MVIKDVIKTNHGDIRLPAFMPDATFGSIRTISFSDAKLVGVEEIVTTTLHIEQKIGSLFIRDFGGIHKFFGWDRPILTDSGGWQVFTLINQKSKIKGQKLKVETGDWRLESGKEKQGAGDEKSQNSKLRIRNFVTEAGCSFFDDSGKQHLLTPESSIQIQYNLGSDIMTVLDNPIRNESTLKERKDSIGLNTKWAKRAKKKFDTLPFPPSREGVRTLLGAVIQGANDRELRRISAEELVEIDFDIYNYGGIPMHSPISWLTLSPDGFNREMLHYVAELIPDNKLKYAMGVGQPEDIAYCVDIGWDLFDTVLPTRNARHGYLYVSEGQGEETREYSFKIKNEKLKIKKEIGDLRLEINPTLTSPLSFDSKGEVSRQWWDGGVDNKRPRTNDHRLAYDIIRLRKDLYSKDNRPVDEHCDCECCRSVSRAYLRHLIRIKEPSGFRLATIHNLKFYSNWMKKLRNER